MFLNDLFKKNINIYIINFEKKYLHYFFGLNSLFYYLSKIYNISLYFYNIEKFDSYEEEFFKMIFNYNINYYFIFEKNNNNKNNIVKDNKKKDEYVYRNTENNYQSSPFGTKNDEQLIFLNKVKINKKKELNINIDISFLLNEKQKDNNILIKIIDFEKIENIKYLYENIFSIPYSLRFLNKNIFRFNDIENNLYNFHINKFNNFSYIFCSSYYHKKDSNYAIFIFLHNFYKSILDFENPFFKSWYYNGDPFYIYGKIIENSEELYIHINDIEWLELCSILDLSKIKSKNIYYNNINKKELEYLKNEIYLFDWNYILLD